MTPKGEWPRSRVLLLKQWDRYPRSTERISCFNNQFKNCTERKLLLFYFLKVQEYQEGMAEARRRTSFQGKQQLNGLGVIFRPCGRINVKHRRYFPSVVDKKKKIMYRLIELFSSNVEA